MNPLRFITPGQLIICLVLFFLPWIEMSCTPPSEAIKKAPKEEIAEFKKKTGVDPTRSIGIVAQSGLQIATGDSSVASDFKKIMEAAKKDGGGGGGMFNIDDDPSKEKQEKAGHLFLYPVALIVGIVFALVPWASPARKFIALGCCLLALGVVGISAAVGFPMDKKVKKETEKLKDMGAMFGPPDGGKSSVKPSDIIGVKWQIPLYLSLVLLIGAAATSVLGDPPPRRHKKRRRYRDEDEDDEEPMSLDDDDEEDAPPRRKKRRRDRDDDDDDRDDRRDRGKKRRRDDDD